MGFKDAFSTDIIKAGLEAIDTLSTSAEERGQLKIELVKETLAAQTSLVQAQSAVIIAEAQGSSWIQRNWRPVTMLTFVGVIVYKYVLRDIAIWFGLELPPLELPEGLWTVIQIGLGGYVLGRSGEKIAETVSGVAGTNLFTSGKIAKKTRKSLLRELRRARKAGDEATVNRILDLIDPAGDPEP